MIEVAPMPDELTAGHLGRLGWLNGCLNENDLTVMIKDAVVKLGFDPESMPRLRQLALLSNMDGHDYARKHSMLASFRVAAKAGKNFDHGAETSAAYSKRLGMLPQRGGAYCCPQCIAEDLKDWGFSWYRRNHHLVGIDWCVVHDSKLSLVDHRNAFSRVPHLWQMENKLIPLTVVVEHLPQNGFLRRFAEISTMLLARERPFLADRINGALAKQAAALELRLSRTGRRPLISDRLSTQVAAPWLCAHLPSWHEKQPSEYFQRIDALATMKTLPGVGEAYAMAMASLYDTTETAMEDVCAAETGQQRTPSKHRRVSRGATFWNGEFWPYYLKCHGQINVIAERLQLDADHVGEVLAALGLPSLHNHEQSKRWAAFIRFCSGESLSAACIAEQVNQSEVEVLLRKCSARVMLAIRKIKNDPPIAQKRSPSGLGERILSPRARHEDNHRASEVRRETDDQRLHSERQTTDPTRHLGNRRFCAK